ncbi:hypothetical protein CAPTEDRAFT_115649, partial [Capitella teleta]
VYRHAAVVTDTDVCARIGSAIQAKYGGSVVDAIIATSVCVGVVNHQSCGIGGGFLATIFVSPRNGEEKEVRSLMAREVAPLLATLDMFVNSTEDSLLGGRAIAVPGEVAGYYEAWLAYGRVEWSQLFKPTIAMCEEGFKVERAMGEVIAKQEKNILDSESLSELYLKPDGTLVQEGDILKNPKLAQTLRRIAESPTSFYNGSLAEDIVLDIRDAGGIITLEDLQTYQAKWKTPVITHLSNGNHTIYSPPPPSSGVVLQYILGILDGYDFSPSSLLTTDKRIETYHRIVEAFKFAYGKRSGLGDEDFVNIQDIVKNMTDPAITQSVRMKINDAKTEPVEYYESAFENSGQDVMGTSHMNVYGADGSAASLTSTINYWFGSKVRGNRTGIMFNNEMDDFSTPGTSNVYGFPASPSNYIVPGKMPLSSMSPSLVFNQHGDAELLAGASGGSKIISATTQVIMNNLWFKMSPIASADQPRLHHQLVRDIIYYEPSFEKVVLHNYWTSIVHQSWLFVGNSRWP